MHDAATDAPVAYAHVYLTPLQRGDATDATGTFRICDVSPRTYQLFVRALGYEPLRRTLTVPHDTTLTLSLSPDPLALDPLVVTPGVTQLAEGGRMHSLSRDHLIQAPNISQDVMRSLQTLPGVANSDYSAKPHVHGGLPHETAVLLDGLELREPYHLEAFDGPFSVVATEWIEQLTLARGPTGAHAPDRLSGTLALESLSTPPPHALTLSIDFLHASLFAAKKVHPKMDAFAAARRGYVDLVLGESVPLTPRYVDAWSKVQVRPRPGVQLDAHLLLTRDGVSWDLRDEGGIAGPEHFNSVRMNLHTWVQGRAIIGTAWHTETLLALQRFDRDATFAFETSLSPDNPDDRRAHVVTAQQTLAFDGLAGHTLTAGAKVKHTTSTFHFAETRYDPRVDAVPKEGTYVPAETVTVNTSSSQTTAAAFVDDMWTIAPGLSIRGGVRFSVASTATSPIIGPHISARYAPTSWLEARMSAGRYAQFESLVTLPVYQGRATPYRAAAHNTQLASSLYIQPPSQLSLKAEAYVKHYDELYPPPRSHFAQRITGFNTPQPLFVPDQGTARGIDVTLTHRTEADHRVQLSYSYSRSYVKDARQREVPRDRDRRHSLAVGGMLQLGKRFTASARWRVHTGEPFTPTTPVVLGDGTNERQQVVYVPGPVRSERVPAYHVLDLKLQKGWRMGTTKLTTYLNVLNAYNRANVRSPRWTRNSQNGVIVGFNRDTLTYFPRLVSLGLRLALF